MSLNIKILIFLLFCGVSIVRAQEKVESTEEDFNADPETVFFNFELFRPLVIGNSSLARDYNTTLGFAFDFNWFVLQELTIGTYFSVFGSNGVNHARIGNIQTTTGYLFGVDAGYYYEFDRHWNIHATVGIGKINYRNSAPEDKFSELGNSYWLQVHVAHRFNKTIALYFKMAPRIDKLEIKAPESMDNFFNNHLFLNPGFGLRINLHNPGG